MVERSRDIVVNAEQLPDGNVIMETHLADFYYTKQRFDNIDKAFRDENFKGFLSALGAIETGLDTVVLAGSGIIYFADGLSRKDSNSTTLGAALVGSSVGTFWIATSLYKRSGLYLERAKELLVIKKQNDVIKKLWEMKE